MKRSLLPMRSSAPAPRFVQGLLTLLVFLTGASALLAQVPDPSWTPHTILSDAFGSAAQGVAPNYVYADDLYENIDYSQNSPETADIQFIRVGEDANYYYIEMDFVDPWTLAYSPGHQVVVEIDVDSDTETPEQGDYYVGIFQKTEFNSINWIDANTAGGYEVYEDQNDDVGGDNPGDPDQGGQGGASGDGYESAVSSGNNQVFARVIGGNFQVAIRKTVVGNSSNGFFRAWSRQSTSLDKSKLDWHDQNAPSDTNQLDNIGWSETFETAVTGTVRFITDLAATADLETIDPGDEVFVEVVDADLNTDSGTQQTVNVTITTDAGDTLVITLSEVDGTGAASNDSDIFRATAGNTAEAAPIVDAILQVAQGETVTVTYVDAEDADGDTNENRTDTLTVNVTAVTGTVRFITDLAATADLDQIAPGDPIYVEVVDADLNTDSGTQQTVNVTITTDGGDTFVVTLHEVDGTGADSNDSDIFRSKTLVTTAQGAVAVDAILQVVPGETVTVTYVDAEDADGNLNQNRTDTLIVINPGGPTTGFVKFVSNLNGEGDETTFDPAVPDTLFILVIDMDQDLDPGVQDTVTVDLIGLTNDDEQTTLVLTEIGTNSGQFTASIPTDLIPPATVTDEDGTIQAAYTEIVRVTYIDAEDADNNLNQVRTDEIVATEPVLQEGFELRPDREGIAKPGSIVTYSHDLQNYGDTAHRFYLTITPGHDSPWSYVLLTADGSAQLPRQDNSVPAHEGEYYIDLSEAGGGTDIVTFQIQIFVPGNVANAIRDITAITAITDDLPGESSSVIDITRSQQGNVMLTKEVDPAGDVAPGAMLTYTTQVFNKGAEAVSNLVIMDAIPAYTTWVPGSITANFGAIGTTAEVSTDGAINWTAPPGAGTVTNIRVSLDAPLPPGASGTVTFEVTVD